MTAFIARRLLALVPLVFVVWSAVFLLLSALPGDAAIAVLGTEATPDLVKQVRANLGLDLPIGQRYLHQLVRTLHGDLGESLVNGRPVGPELAARYPATLEIAVVATAVFMLLGLPLGTIAALRRNSGVDYASRTLAVVGLSVPNFWLALVLMLVFSLRLRLLPSQGYVPLNMDPLKNLAHLALPAASLGVAMTASVARMTRSSLLDVLGHDFVRTARAKGLAPAAILSRHMLRNALLPIVAVVALEQSVLFGGTIIVEQIFAWPGIGRMALDAIFQRDYPSLQATVLAIVASIILINVLADVAYAALDPRIRYD
jgi:peptide/nickel transport system permease protein